MPTLRAGASVITITPPLGTPLSGYFTHRPAATVADDLTARPLVLDDGATRIALVVCDLVSLTAEIANAARELISARTGIPGTHVMISGTHTHTGPALRDLGEETADRAYLPWLAGRIADGVAIAASRLVPARLAHGVADVAGVCFNRRYRMRDGTVVFNPGIGNPDVVGPVGPVDPQVTSLLIEDTSGTPLALWANLALHYVGTDDANAISADYYGHFARAVSRTLGDGCVGILSNGTSGNINNIDVSGAVEAKGDTRSRLVGMTVAAAAIQAPMMQRRHDSITLAAETFPMTVRRRAVSTEDLALAERILALPPDETPYPAPFGFAPGSPIPRHWVRVFAGEALAVARMPATATIEVQVMRIGDLALVAFPGELFVELGLAIKAGSPFARTAVVTLTDADPGYVPTEAAFDEGAYETWTARSSWVAPGTGEAMVAAALDRLHAMHARARAM